MRKKLLGENPSIGLLKEKAVVSAYGYGNPVAIKE